MQDSLNTEEYLHDKLTVNDVVRVRPEALRVFSSFGIDTCCGGRHTISEAARRHGLDIQVVMRELRAALA